MPVHYGPCGAFPMMFRFPAILRKTTALLTAVLFLVMELVFPLPSAGAQLAAESLFHGVDARLLAENPFGIRLNEEQGTVAGFFDGDPGQPLVVLIQDAHANISAQKSVEGIISTIVGGGRSKVEGGREKNQNVSPSTFHLRPSTFQYVLVEGASGFVSRAPLTAFTSQGADPVPMLLAKGMINGPELAALKNQDLVLWGIEDAGLYDKNLSAWVETTRLKEKNLAAIDPLLISARDLLWTSASPEFKTLLKADEELSAEDGDAGRAAKLLEKFMRLLRKDLWNQDAARPINAVELQRKFPSVYHLLQMEYLWEDARAELEAIHKKKLEVGREK